MRLSRKHSMNQRSQFYGVRVNGRSKTGRFLILSTLEDHALPHLKLGLITTRKVGKAHERNLLRRRFRAIVQRHGDQFIESRRFLVTIPRRGSAVASFADLEKDWLKQARRLGLMKTE